MLISISWTASSAQTLRLDSDTIHCYDRSEMRAIAIRVIEATECDTITDILQEEIAVRDSVISAQEQIISAKNSEITLGKTMLEDSDQLAKNYEEELKSEVKRHKMTKIKWYVTVALTVIVMTLITK
jgi:predicted nucleic acid-binding Zn ribbon protein